ncbi:hypothetical protein MEO41_28015, partial [Dolichospermum sp. ST_sed4]|nr:hypothetical protein [Dolichospermum sp. ST_sed4]
QYRFRILNGSTERFYNLKLSNKQSFIQIGSDGGFLPSPVELTELLISPAERADILIDFSKLEPGTKIILTNDALDNHDKPPDPETTGQIMQFTITNSKVCQPKQLPAKLNKIPKLKSNSPNRILTLTFSEEIFALLLNGQPYEADVTETPLVGSTEICEIVNLTEGPHP